MQRQAYDIIEKWNIKNNAIHNKEIVFPHLVEEIGELAKEIGKEKSNWRGEFDKDKLSEELIDVLLQIMNLATDYNINIEETFNKKIQKLKERYNIS